MSGQAIAIIQARMSSSRLPGKVMMPLAGRPMIWHIVERARACRLVEKVVVATSTERSDDPLAACCQQEGIDCFRGSLDNVLSRFIKILDDYPYEYCVRITGDCPLIDPEFIDKQIFALQTNDADLVWLDPSVSVLEGQGAHSASSLKLIASKSQHPDDLEHVGSRFLSEHPDKFRIIGMHPPESLSNLNWRITVDEVQDYRMMQHLYEDLWDGEPVPLEAAFTWLAQNSDLSKINKKVEHSAINQELAAKRRAWKRHIALFFDWKTTEVGVELT